jgi:hypothetical protein
MRRSSVGSWSLAAFVAWVAAGAGCGAAGNDMTPAARSVGETVPKPAAAGANVGIAGAMYVFGGGCKRAGCPTNWHCNEKTERCEAVPCGGHCLLGEQCNEARGACEAK